MKRCQHLHSFIIRHISKYATSVTLSSLLPSVSPPLQVLIYLTLSTTSPSCMFPSRAARLSGEMSFTKMWLARRSPYSAYRVNRRNTYTMLVYVSYNDAFFLMETCIQQNVTGLKRRSSTVF